MLLYFCFSQVLMPTHILEKDFENVSDEYKK